MFLAVTLAFLGATSWIHAEEWTITIDNQSDIPLNVIGATRFGESPMKYFETINPKETGVLKLDDSWPDWPKGFRKFWIGAHITQGNDQIINGATVYCNGAFGFCTFTPNKTYVITSDTKSCKDNWCHTDLKVNEKK
jgi:hypothetical protein